VIVADCSRVGGCGKGERPAFADLGRRLVIEWTTQLPFTGRDTVHGKHGDGRLSGIDATSAAQLIPGTSAKKGGSAKPGPTAQLAACEPLGKTSPGGP
jgi:hypothetical protein